MFYILFFPIRFVKRHKLAVFFLFVIIYMLLAFTDYGRAFTNKYLNIDLKEVQNTAVSKVKDYSSYALSEFNRLTGINEWRQRKSASQPNSQETLKSSDISNSDTVSGKLYSVTAKKGLNIRKSPDPASDKVGENSLTFGSTVTYLSKTKTDASGRTWYYIKAKDGRIGWVSASYLREKEG